MMDHTEGNTMESTPGADLATAVNANLDAVADAITGRGHGERAIEIMDIAHRWYADDDLDTPEDELFCLLVDVAKLYHGAAGGDIRTHLQAVWENIEGE